MLCVFVEKLPLYVPSPGKHHFEPTIDGAHPCVITIQLEDDPELLGVRELENLLDRVRGILVTLRDVAYTETDRTRPIEEVT